MNEDAGHAGPSSFALMVQDQFGDKATRRVNAAQSSR